MNAVDYVVNELPRKRNLANQLKISGVQQTGDIKLDKLALANHLLAECTDQFFKLYVGGREVDLATLGTHPNSLCTIRVVPLGKWVLTDSGKPVQSVQNMTCDAALRYLQREFELSYWQPVFSLLYYRSN